RGWLSTQAIVGRANYAVALVQGRLWARPAPLDGAAVARRHGRGRDLDDLLAVYAGLLTGASPAGWRMPLAAALGSGRPPDRETVALAVTLASPEVQLA